jgi:hypothetical protein
MSAKTVFVYCGGQKAGQNIPAWLIPSLCIPHNYVGASGRTPLLVVNDTALSDFLSICFTPHIFQFYSGEGGIRTHG